MADVLEIAVKERRIIRVAERGDFALAFTVREVAALEDKLGRSMKSAADWLNIKTKEVRDILEAGFRHYHPDEAGALADEICSVLGPEEIEHLIDAICVAACPKAMARIQDEIVKIRERMKKELPPLPNGVSADAAS